MTFEQWFDKYFPVECRNFGCDAAMYVVKDQYRQVWEAAQDALRKEMEDSQ